MAKTKDLTWKYENDQWTRLPHHIRHLPIITRHFDLFSAFIRFVWSQFLKNIFFKYYMKLEVVGDMRNLMQTHPKLIVMSNHGSHLDAISIATAAPIRYWLNIYFAAAKDYFFSNFFMSFFSKHCIGAIPIERKKNTGEAIKLCITLLERLDNIWLVLFPEGTRTKDGYIHPFKRGVSLFALKTNVPILFLYLEGAYDSWPKGAGFARMGSRVRIHVGPVQRPAPVEEVYSNYKAWVNSVKPGQFYDEIKK
ncbi:MAG: 1-acyl-sn-glycerol-3-phosphate acyltransferase [Bdellovibrionales bacterium]|nr:1-acyl-sn-glycerol-3-phosphate acyltransferase [Bdellovibrionales bacterium]